MLVGHFSLITDIIVKKGCGIFTAAFLRMGQDYLAFRTLLERRQRVQTSSFLVLPATEA
jgi:hypothetical protein